MDHDASQVKLSPFSVVVVQRESARGAEYLAVDESRNRGWWLPAGHMDAGQTPAAAAHKETMEEGGVAIELTGLLRIEQWPRGKSQRMRFVYGARPLDPDAEAKQVADAESDGARWVRAAELETMRLRGRELIDWGSALDGAERSVADVWPLDVLVAATGVPDGDIEPPAMSAEEWVLGPRPVEDSASVLGSDELMAGPTSGWTRATGCPTLLLMTMLVFGPGGDVVCALERAGISRADSVAAAADKLLAAELGPGADGAATGLIRMEMLLHGLDTVTVHYVVAARLAPGPLPPSVDVSPKVALYAALVASHNHLPIPFASIFTLEGAPVALPDI